jgi:hypothetical protein
MPDLLRYLLDTDGFIGGNHTPDLNNPNRQVVVVGDTS